MRSMLHSTKLLIAFLIFVFPNLVLVDDYYAAPGWANASSDKAIQLGTLATIDEVCQLIDHPVFTIKQQDSNLREPWKQSYFGFGADETPYTYLFIPIDNVITEFKSMFPARYQLGRDKKETFQMMQNISYFPECFIKARDIGVFKSISPVLIQEQNTYGTQTDYPLIQWTERKPERLVREYYSNLVSVGSVKLSAGAEGNTTCMGCIFFLKEIHPSLIERFDELYAAEVDRLKRAVAHRKVAEKYRLEALLLLNDEEAAKLRLQEVISIEAEKLRIEKINIDLNAERDAALLASKEEERFRQNSLERRLKLKIEAEERQESQNLKIFFIVFVISIFIARYLFQKRKERNDQLIELEKLELAREVEQERKNTENRKREKSIWSDKRKALVELIRREQSDIKTKEKEEKGIKVKIKKTEREKKSLEEEINHLNDEITNEKKIVKELRKKYPFIDCYIDNR